MTDFLAEAKAIAAEAVSWRRTFHGYAELNFDLDQTVAFVMEKLKSFGYEPELVGKAGVSCVVGQGGKVLLLRADMDSLPMAEQSGLPFAAKGNSCHSCGHDIHTAMLLAAARILKEHESELCGRVKFMFQPAEEILGGANDMIEAGILENPHVDAAIGMHTAVGNSPVTNVGNVSFKRDYSHYSGDMMKVIVHGKQAHGSTPEDGVDAISIAAHITIGVQELVSREVGILEPAMVLVGKIYGGDSCNTEAGTCTLELSVRTASAPIRDFLIRRVGEIAQGTAMTYRGTATVEHTYGIGPMYNHPDMIACVPGYAAELLGQEHVVEVSKPSGTEDFSAIAARVPSIYLCTGFGSTAGEGVNIHNPHVIFDEAAIPTGIALYCHTAARWLEEHQ